MTALIVGGHVLVRDADRPTPGWLQLEDDRIIDIGVGEPTGIRADTVIEATGAWVLPGIVDIHGDAFERSLMPRGGVRVPMPIALSDTADQLASNGITTAYLSATDSWEPGLRSRATLRELAAGLAEFGAATGERRPTVDLRLHVRHERCHTDELEELLGWLADGTITLLSYNDHTIDRMSASATQLQRSGVTASELAELERAAVERRELGRSQEPLLAAAAARAACPTASHDADSGSDLERDVALGVSIAEFPTSISLAQDYQAAGIPVLLGAPNLVRGGSHLGNLSAAEALAVGAGSMLCSDYHYPSLLQAPFVVAADSGRGDAGLSFGRAWDLVSANPAAAAGLGDRGRLNIGARADVIVVDPPLRPGDAAAVRAVLAAGAIVRR